MNALAKPLPLHDVFLEKIGTEIKENIDQLKIDISELRKQYPGKFTTEVDAAGIIKKLEEATGGLSSHDDKLKSEIMSGKFGTSLNSNLKEIKEAIKKIWVQVKGSELKYTRKDTLEGLQIQIFSKLIPVAVFLGKIVALLIAVAIAGFIYLYVTMEKENTYIKLNDASNAFIEEQMIRVREINERKADLSEGLAIEAKKEDTQERMIAMMKMETEMQELNHELHSIEGNIASRKDSIAESNEKIKELESKSFYEKLLKKK